MGARGDLAAVVVVKPALRRREAGRGRLGGSWFLVLGSWLVSGMRGVR